MYPSNNQKDLEESYSITPLGRVGVSIDYGAIDIDSDGLWLSVIFFTILYYSPLELMASCITISLQAQPAVSGEGHALGCLNQA